MQTHTHTESVVYKPSILLKAHQKYKLRHRCQAGSRSNSDTVEPLHSPDKADCIPRCPLHRCLDIFSGVKMVMSTAKHSQSHSFINAYVHARLLINQNNFFPFTSKSPIQSVFSFYLPFMKTEQKKNQPVIQSVNII